ncbi:MAG: hypothetical protein P4L55_16245 [Syntrophobacteraceae bacterium]|nr:hypothetical protein [Syntrophobacteraceae bacterium]
MPRKVTATELRKNIYKLLDDVLQSNIPLEVERKGKKIIISSAQRDSKMAGLRPHPDCIAGDPEELVHSDWSGEWSPDI